ncbi:hypothetical protein ACPVPU_11175 [Sphingomonas sp. CJ99]
MSYQILDCTLRDGGYYTNWDFDEDLVEEYLHSVARVPVEHIEIGYCSPPKPGYRGEWCYLDRTRLQWVKDRLRADQSLVVMLDAKDWQPDMIEPYLKPLVGIVDMVRMAIAPSEFVKGLALSRALKALGFKVGFNTMYLSKYSPDLRELDPLRGNADCIDILSLVDSFGGCTPDDVSAKIALAREAFPGTPIGFHGHDNTCLGYANALAALSAGAEVIDATFVGMGRGAGNTRTEMLIVHKAADDGDALEATAHIVDRFEQLRTIYKWGTNLPYMMSGAANLPQKDVMDWLGKNRYGPVTVIRALQQQSSGSVDQTTYPELRQNSLPADAGRVTLIIGGGPSVQRHGAAIRRFVETSGAAVIHANTRYADLLGAFGTYELLCLPGDAAHHLPDGAVDGKIAGVVVPNPPRFRGSVPANIGCPIFQAAPFGPAGSDQLGPISDIGPLALAAGAARAIAASTIFLVGFDGYDDATVAQQELMNEIQATIDGLAADGSITIASLTPTRYALPVRSVYAEAQALVA